MLHQPQMIETGNMVIGYLQSLLEHIDGLLILPCILIGQTLAVEELGISRHQPDRIIEILVGEIDLLQGEIGITTIEQRPGIARVQGKCFIIFEQALIIHLIMIQRQRLIIVISCLRTVKLNGLFESLQGEVVFLILEITQPQVVLSRSILLKRLTRLSQIRNRLRVLLYLTITVPPVKQRLEIRLPRFYVLQTFSKILDRMGKVHESGVHEASVEVVETVVGFQTNCFLEFCESVVDLVEHHHAVTSVCIVLRVFIVETDCSTEVIHCLLVVSDRHKGITSISVIFCMS